MSGVCLCRPGTKPRAALEYDGARGADRWGQLDSRFQACAVGSEQSPIDITRSVRADIGRLDIKWEPQPFEVVNNGHTIQPMPKPAAA